MAEMYNHWQAGRVDQAREIHLKLLPLMFALFLESNPIPVKAAMELLGLCTGEIRPPLAPMSSQLRPRLEKVLADNKIPGDAK
jgi:4-hydroxy-tetrahydrodipicolinate synthase